MKPKIMVGEGSTQSPFRQSTRDLVRDLANEIDVFDDMLTSLVEILEKKGILTQEEWENKIKAKIEKRSKSKSYRAIQFGEAET